MWIYRQQAKLWGNGVKAESAAPVKTKSGNHGDNKIYYILNFTFLWNFLESLNGENIIWATFFS